MLGTLQEVAARHVDSLANKANSSRSHPTRRFVLSLLGPVIAAAALLVVMIIWRIAVPPVDPVLNGLAIGTGLLFALVIFVFQLRLQVTSDPRLTQAEMLKDNIDALFSNVMYGILVGLCGVASAMAAAMTMGTLQLGLFVFTIFVTLHWLAIVLLSVRRTLRAYQALSV